MLLNNFFFFLLNYNNNPIPLVFTFHAELPSQMSKKTMKNQPKSLKPQYRTMMVLQLQLVSVRLLLALLGMYLAKDILGVFVSLVVRRVRAEALPFPLELFLGLNLMSFQPYFLSHNPLILLLDQPLLDVQLVLSLITKAGMNPYRNRRVRPPTKEKVGTKPIFQIEEMMRIIILLEIMALRRWRFSFWSPWWWSSRQFHIRSRLPVSYSL